MSNSNTTIRNVYNSASRTDEMAMLLNQSDPHESDDTTIIIGNDLSPSTSQQYHHRQPLLLNARRESVAATRINIEEGDTVSGIGGTVDDSNGNVEDRQRARNLFSMLRGARHHLHRQQSSRDHPLGGNTGSPGVANGDSMTSGSLARTWRNNLYDVLSSPGNPRTDVLRAIFSPSASGTVRYNSLPTNENVVNSEESFHILLNRSSLDNELQRNHQPDMVLEELNLSDNSATTPTSPVNGARSDGVETPVSRRQSNGSGGSGGGNNNERLPSATPSQRQTSSAGSTAPTVDMDDADATAMGELIVKMVSHFVRYLPFIGLLLVKFIYDHFLGILDLSVLTAAVFCVNKTLKEQVAKPNQKSYTLLVRETLVIVFIVTYRFLLSSSAPDPFGLLINPPGEKLSMNSSLDNESPLSTIKSYNADGATVDPLHTFQVMPSPLKHINVADELPSLEPTSKALYSSTILLTKTVSLGVLLYYVAVNDLVLKLLTQMVKISITMLPTKVIRHKSRGRLYALVEYVSQFYRALVPMRQWLTFLFESYSGLEIVSGIIFSSFYLGAKGFEFVERGKSSKKAIVNFIRNMQDYDRKPTNDELNAAGTVCPICHDSYTTPVVLECSHIFCDECVNTWFKREQTCPMCRAEVREDPTWQDGATTFFLQLF